MEHLVDLLFDLVGRKVHTMMDFFSVRHSGSVLNRVWRVVTTSRTRLRVTDCTIAKISAAAITSLRGRDLRILLFMPKALLDPFPEAKLRLVNMGMFACFDYDSFSL